MGDNISHVKLNIAVGLHDDPAKSVSSQSAVVQNEGDSFAGGLQCAW